MYSLIHLECHFFILKSQSMIKFSRSLLPRSVEKRPRRLGLEIEIKWHSKYNRLYIYNQPKWKISIVSINFPSRLKFLQLWYPTVWGIQLNQPRWKIRQLWYPTACGMPLPVVSYHICIYTISLDGKSPSFPSIFHLGWKFCSCGIPLPVVSYHIFTYIISLDGKFGSCGIPLCVVSYHICIYIISRDGKSPSFPSIFHLGWKFGSCGIPLPVVTHCLWYPIIYVYI